MGAMRAILLHVYLHRRAGDGCCGDVWRAVSRPERRRGRHCQQALQVRQVLLTCGCVHLLVLHKLDSRSWAIPAHMPEVHLRVCSYGVPDGKILGIRYGFR